MAQHGSWHACSPKSSIAAPADHSLGLEPHVGSLRQAHGKEAAWAHLPGPAVCSALHATSLRPLPGRDKGQPWWAVLGNQPLSLGDSASALLRTPGNKWAEEQPGPQPRSAGLPRLS